MAIDIKTEIDEANARMPVAFPDHPMSLDMQIRCTALLIAQRHVGDTCIKEGGLYQQLKMDNKLGGSVSIDDVIKAALVMERYLWGEWSKGIAENALASVETEIADAIEDALDKRIEDLDDSPVRKTPG